MIEQEKYIREIFETRDGGHDWWHIFRVWKSAVYIGKLEDANLYIIELAALLHDLGDYKLNSGKELGSIPTREWLTQMNIDSHIIKEVAHIIDNMSFRKTEEAEQLSLEGQIVQDADRLDGIGAIGIARVFTFGGHHNNEIYNPDLESSVSGTSKNNNNVNSSSIKHFYDKLLHLKDLINTNTAKKIAEERHQYMEQFLNRFHHEWHEFD